jgi:hypothetical protein
MAIRITDVGVETFSLILKEKTPFHVKKPVNFTD